MRLIGRVNLEELRSAGVLRVPYPPFDILVVWHEGGAYALEDACNHAGASLAEGWVEDGNIVCPMHGYVFELATGQLLRPRGLCGDQRRYVTKLEDDEVLIYDEFRLVVV
jgi:nitrite reductase/ring-hydroxylating ferredoxin subunit